jgi:hypothetical protein
VSGVVYDVIHDVPFVGTNQKGEAVIFAGGVIQLIYSEQRTIWSGGSSCVAYR